MMRILCVAYVILTLFFFAKEYQAQGKDKIYKIKKGKKKKAVNFNRVLSKQLDRYFDESLYHVYNFMSFFFIFGTLSTILTIYNLCNIKGHSLFTHLTELVRP